MRYSSGEWEHVLPENLGINQLDNEDRGNMFEWKNIVGGLDSLFDGAIITLDLRDMFVTGDHIDYDTESGEVSSHGLKLIIGKDDGDWKTPGCVYAQHNFEMTDDCLVVKGIELSS